LPYLYRRLLASQAMYSYVNYPLRLNNIIISTNSIILHGIEPKLDLCQGRRTPDWSNLGYEARSCRPSSPVRLDPSTAGLRENKRLGNSFLIDYSWLSILVLIERYLYFPS
jgi:hypothetical protein